MKKKKPFVKKDAGNVPAGIQFFNKSMGMGESMQNEKVTLEYEDLPIEVNYGEIDDTTGVGREFAADEVSYDFEVDKERVVDKIWDFMQEDVSWGDVVESFNNSEDVKAYIEENFDELFDYFNEDLLHHFKDEAIEEAIVDYEVPEEDDGEYYYEDEDFFEDYEQPRTLRESIKKLDVDTDGEYDLLNLYEASLIENNRRGCASLERMLKEGKDASVIYRHLNRAFLSSQNLHESIMSDLDIEVQEAGGKEDWLYRADAEIKHLETELAFLKDQAPREMRVGGAFDSIVEIEDAITATEEELENWRNKKAVVMGE